MSLLDLIEQHRDAIEYDLIKLGLRLRWLDGDRFDFADLATIVRQAPADSAIYRSMYGEESIWQIDQHLLAAMADSLHFLAWAKTKDAERGRNRPKPIPRPGVEPDKEAKTYSSKEDALPVAEMAEWLGWNQSSHN